ncbi:MAG TPA: Hpt domain-containing protein [Allosphingosinicella sp.]|jgi:HPt (histidine-containing phosphotransfer) domain-containing protein
MSGAPDPMAGLKDRFRARLAEERSLLASAAASGDSATLRSICHRIAGAGGMFGYGQLSALASRVEEAIDDDRPPGTLARLSADLLRLIDDVVAQDAEAFAATGQSR